MKKKICYAVYLFLLFVGLGLQLKFLAYLQYNISSLVVFPTVKAVYANLSYLLIGAVLFLEGKLAAAVDRNTRIAGRLILSAVLLYEIFKLPIFKSFSLFSDWSYVMAAASMTAAYLLISSLWELASAGNKKAE